MSLLSRDRIKGFFAGLLASIGTWVFVVTGIEYFFKSESILFRFVVASILILLSWYIGASK